MVRPALAAAACLSLLFGRSALAATLECTGPEVEADAAVIARFPQALAKLRAHVASLADVDTCARVDLITAGSDVVVVVTLKDGRSTIRRVASEDELVEVVEALVVLPPSSGNGSSSGVEPIAPPSKPPEPLPPPLPSHVAPPRPVRGAVELGVGGAGHALGKPFFLGVGLTAFAQMSLGQWLLGVNARIDAIDLPVGGTEVPDDFQMRTYSIGVAAGRRTHFGAIDFDLLAGLGLERQFQSAHPMRGERLRSTWTDGRVMVVARLSESGPAKVRAFIQADVEGWLPDREEAPPKPLPDWPYWSLGVAFGLTWEGS